MTRMTAHDPYGRQWPVKQQTITVGSFSITLECVTTFDDVLDDFSRSHPNDTDMIPYFADLWPSAKALASHLTKRFDTLTAHKVIELGCGLALPAITASLMGADVTATDFHPDNLPYLRANADLNHLRHFRAIQMDWRHPSEDQTYDLILGSDLLYEKQQVETLTACIDPLLANDGILLLADPMRSQLQAAVDALTARGFASEMTFVDDIAIIEAKRH